MESCFEEQSFKKKQEIFHEISLFELCERYKSEEGKKFVEKVIVSQVGKNHLQFKGDAEMKLYKIFVRSETKDGTSTATSSKVRVEGGQETSSEKQNKRKKTMHHLIVVLLRCVPATGQVENNESSKKALGEALDVMKLNVPSVEDE